MTKRPKAKKPTKRKRDRLDDILDALYPRLEAVEGCVEGFDPAMRINYDIHTLYRRAIDRARADDRSFACLNENLISARRDIKALTDPGSPCAAKTFWQRLRWLVSGE